MKYSEYLVRTHFSQAELLALAHGRLVDDAPGPILHLPAPPLMMVDRVLELERGTRGRLVAELDVRLDAWYFQCHFIGDPVQPGCLGLDGVWQLMGIYMSASGGLGIGRALGCKELEFSGQIRPHDRVVRYDVSIRRLAQLKSTGTTIAIADATVAVDGQVVYRVAGARAGLFRNIAYPDYPIVSRNATGGIMEGANE